MAQMKGGRAVIETLRAEGVDTVFGIISTHMTEIYDALYDHRETFRLITTRHEEAAAHMADGYARVSGRPGVCFSSTGPGAANSVSGLGEAFFASSPVLSVTSTAEEKLYGRGLGVVHETKDQLGMLSAVTGWSVHVGDPKAIPDRLYEAFQRLNTRRPQPVAVEIAVDVQGQTAEVEIPQRREFTKPVADAASIERAARLLLSGKRVAILAGNGVHRAGASGEVLRLAEALGVPVVTTTAGKGAVPEDHRLSLGAITGTGNPKPSPLKAFLEGLDTVLVVGSSLAHSRTKAAGLKLPPNLVHVDIDGESIGKVYPAAVSVVGDAKTALAQLARAVQGKRPQLPAGFDREVAQLKAAIGRYWWETMPNEMRAYAALREVMARDAIFVGDVTMPIHRGAVNCLPVYEPRTYLTPQWNGLGFAFPASAGAKAALPQRQVVCVTGDGGFQFNMQEMGTCLQYGLNPVVLLFNDNAYGVLKVRQRISFNSRIHGVDLRNPDWVHLGESYGANAVRARTAAEAAKALEAGLASDTLTLIEVPIPEGFANFK